MIVAPPRPPSSPAEREALIQEARERQRRRRLLAAATVAIVTAMALSAGSLLGQNAGRTTGASGDAGKALCGEGCGANLPAEMLALTSLWYQHGDFYGNGLLRVDPKTLRPLQSHSLRLGDAVATEVLSPDGDQIALGGTNMGEILFPDRKLEHVSWLTLVPHAQRLGTVEVDVVAWPRRSRLIAIATRGMSPWWAPKQSELFVVDPTSRRIIRQVPLHGEAGSDAAVTVRDGTTAFLVNNDRGSRLVAVRPNGSTWSVSLRGLRLRAGKSLVFGGTAYAPQRSAGLATDGGDRVFVVAADRPIGEIRLRERELRYHRVALPRTYSSYPKPQSPGSGGVALKFDASATWEHGLLAIGSADDLPVATPGGTWNRFATRAVQMVDTRTWRWTGTRIRPECQRDGTVFLCNGRRPSIVAYDSSWHRLWASGSTQLGWAVTAGRLLTWPFLGSWTKELNPATGRVLRRINPLVTSALEGGGLPELIPLRPRR